MPEALKLRIADKIQQRVKTGFRLAGETDDERRAQRDAGDAGTDAFDEIHDVLLRGLAPHPFEHVLVDVLERDVDVARDLLALGDGLDEFIRPVRRMRVKQADPEITFERIQLPEQRANGGGIGSERFRRRIEFLGRGNGAAVVRAQVEAVIGGVL